MPSISRFPSQIEPLEARIAPATITNALPDIVAGIGKTNATIDLSKLTATAASDAYHTKVTFKTNYDTDPNTAGVQGDIVIELYDDTTPLTVQNFLSYLNGLAASSDYDNTVFHRSFDFGSGSGTGKDIIQGGGFDFANLKAHIPTGPELHNEYNDARPNARGTIAMAKVGGDPNSATSEWFFNVNDNNSILGSGNNGGFTVFGKVVSGMNVVDAIAGLTTFNLSSIVNPAFSDIPLQNYTSGAPTANQVIRIVDAIVEPSTPGTAPGLIYTVQSIFKDGTTTNSDLLTATINGSTLGLNFAPGKSGIAEVTIAVNDAGVITTDTFKVDVRPNLYTDLTFDSLPRFLLPGDVGNVKFEIVNSGATTGTGTVSVYLAKVTVTKNSSGQITNVTEVSGATPIVLGTPAYSLASGKSQSFSIPATVPSTPFDGDEVYYKVITEIVPTGDERFADDNKSLQTSLHAAVNKFGTLSDINFGTRTNAVLKYTTNDIAGAPVVVSWAMKGPGSGTVGFDAQKQSISLTTQGTSLASTVTPTYSKAGSRIELDAINFNSPIGVASLGSVNVSGLVAVAGGIKTLTLGDLSGDSLLLINPVLFDPKVKAAITLRDVTNFSIQSSQPIASLAVGKWIDTGGADDSITAPSLGTLKASGDFQANVEVVDDVPVTSINVAGLLKNATIRTAGNLGAITLGNMEASKIFAGVDSLSDSTDGRAIQSLTIKGEITGSQVAAQTIGPIKVTGALKTSTIQTIGNMGAVSLGGIETSNVFAGVDSRPDALADFTIPRTIQSFTVTGGLFKDSQVAAQTIGSIIVKGAITDASTGDFGFVADVIKSYSRAASTGVPAITKTNLTTAQVVDDNVTAFGDYLVRVL